MTLEEKVQKIMDDCDTRCFMYPRAKDIWVRMAQEQLASL